MERKQNMAPKELEGMISFNVHGNTLGAIMPNGLPIEVKCHPADKFSLSEGMRVLGERMEEALCRPKKVEVGSIVNVTNPNDYSRYINWVKKNAKDSNQIATYAYGKSVVVDWNAVKKYKVLVIAPFDDWTPNKLVALIMDYTNGATYLIDVNKLKVVK